MMKKCCSFASRIAQASKKGKTQKIKQNKSQTKECRICLQDSSDQSFPQMFLHPCKCTGSIKYVHEQCLSEWISYAVGKKKEKDEKQKVIEEGVPCSMCKFPIKFQHSEKVECRNWQNLKEHIRTQMQIFLLSMAIITASIVGIISISFVLYQLIMKYSLNEISVVLPIISALGVIAFFCFLGLGIFMFVKNLVIYKKNIITNIKDLQQAIQAKIQENNIEALSEIPSEDLSHHQLEVPK